MAEHGDVATGPGWDPAFVERFWDKVEPEPNSGCWLWSGALGTNGYGNLRVGSQKDGTRRSVSAHRVAFELAGGDAGVEVVMHTCDVKSCVNPSHLVGGTQLENVRDCMSKGRAKFRFKRGHCHRAPPLSGERNGMARMTNEDVLEIRRRVGAGESKSSVARSLGISGTQVGRIFRRESWGHVNEG